jgi:hypothetical protein
MVTIAVLKVKNALSEAFGGSDFLSNIDLIKTAMYAGIGIVGGFVAIMLVLGAVVASVVAPFVVLTVAALKAYDFLMGLDFGAIATALIDGLVNGISSGVGMVIDAIKGLASSAMGALKSALGIASPSKVFTAYGKFTAEGFAQGTEDGSGRVNDAVASMVEPPALAGAGGSRGGGSKGGNTFNITISGVSNADSLREPAFLDKLAAAIEDALQGGGEPLEPEPA